MFNFSIMLQEIDYSYVAVYFQSFYCCNNDAGFAVSKNIQFIAQTRLCNILQFFTAVKTIIFR